MTYMKVFLGGTQVSPKTILINPCWGRTAGNSQTHGTPYVVKVNTLKMGLSRRTDDRLHGRVCGTMGIKEQVLLEGTHTALLPHQVSDNLMKTGLMAVNVQRTCAARKGTVRTLKMMRMTQTRMIRRMKSAVKKRTMIIWTPRQKTQQSQALERKIQMPPEKTQTFAGNPCN